MADFLVANFNGTGDLTAYTPETGTAFTAPGQTNLLVGNPSNWTGGITAAERLTSGSWQFKWNNGVEHHLYVLQPGTGPSSPDYYLETTIALDSVHEVGMTFAMVGRATPSIADPNVMNCIGVVWTMDDMSDATNKFIHGYVGYVNYDGGAPSISGTNTAGDYYNRIMLNTNPSVTLRVEWQGNAIRGYVDGVKTIDMIWEDTTVYDAAGTVQFQFNFIAPSIWYNTGDYNNAAFDTMKAGDLVPVGPSVFWTDFRKTYEVVV